MYMVTPYMDHDLAGLLENPDVKFSEEQIKCYMKQLLEGVQFIHNVSILSYSRKDRTEPSAEPHPTSRHER